VALPGEESSRQSPQVVDPTGHHAGRDHRLLHPGWKGAHALHVDCKTALGPWITFASGEALDRALVYLGATEDQMEDHRKSMRVWGQGSTHIRLLPNRKNLLRIDWSKL
jgi:hypothetical protein